MKNLVQIVAGLSVMASIIAAPALLVSPASAGYTCTTTYNQFTRSSTTRCY